LMTMNVPVSRLLRPDWCFETAGAQGYAVPGGAGGASWGEQDRTGVLPTARHIRHIRRLMSAGKVRGQFVLP
jgi:hypothetical protein